MLCLQPLARPLAVPWPFKVGTDVALRSYSYLLKKPRRMKNNNPYIALNKRKNIFIFLSNS